MKIAALQKSDYTDWLPLWDANCEGQITPEVTQATWQRICDPESPVGGLGVRTDEGDLAGILHYILHPTTGSTEMVCYMQDLFVKNAHRRKGCARAMVKALAGLADKQGWNRIYWLAENDNTRAQNLYKNIGVKLDFTLHILPVSMRT